MAPSAEAGVPALALLGAGAGLDATLQALGVDPPQWRVVMCMPGSPADRSLVEAWAARRGRDVEFVPVPLDATPAQRLAALLAAAAADVVVLPPGSVPAPGSLEALVRSLHAGERVASATPWSNDGELAGFPRIGERQPFPEDLGALSTRLERSAADAGLPIAGCHAVALAHAAVGAVGGLDDTSYFSTYASLVDLFLRQSAFGWCHRLATRSYVGSRQEQGPGVGDMQQLTLRYPDYGRRVAEFLMSDPLRSVRAELAAEPAEGALSAASVSLQGDLFG